MSAPTELRRIKPIALGSDVVPGRFDGPRPVLKWLPPTELLVDSTYQRDLSERSMRLIRKLAAAFSWNRMKPIIGVQVGATSIHVVDGQHSAIVAASIGVPQVPVYLVEAESVVDRARAFVGHNNDRIKVSPFDIYRALVAAGDPDALDVANVCRRAGVRIRNISPSSSIAEGDTAAVGVIQSLVKRCGVIRSRKILQCLVRAQRAPITAAEILAVAQIIGVDRPAVDLDALTAVIRIEGDAGLAKAHAKSKSDRTLFWREVMTRYLRRLDREAS
jgi:hypothetical protein